MSLSDTEKAAESFVSEKSSLESEPQYIIDPEAERRYANLLYDSLEPSAQIFGRLVKRLDMRIIPASMIIYLLCFLDRSNIVCSTFILPSWSED